MLDFLKSQRGQDKLLYDGFVYTRQHPNKDFWICDLSKTKKCRARVITRDDGTRVEVMRDHDNRDFCREHACNEISKAKRRRRNKHSNILGYVMKIMSCLLNGNPDDVAELELVEHRDKVSKEFMELYKYAYRPEMKLRLNLYYNIVYSFVDEWKYTYVFNWQIDASDSFFDNLVQNYQRLNSQQFGLVNISTQHLLHVHADAFLQQIGATDIEKRVFRRLIHYVNWLFLAVEPYTLTCKCQQEVGEQDFIHSLSNFMNLIGCVEHVKSSNSNFEEMVKAGKICRHGRFKDALAFRNFYFNTQINVSGDTVSPEYRCDCNLVYSNNGVHFLSNWMLKNKLVTQNDFDKYAPSNHPVNRRCPAGHLLLSLDMLKFFKNSPKFAKFDEWDELNDGHLYFSFCVRVLDRQGAIICRTKSRIVTGGCMYLGMNMFEHYHYKGGHQRVKDILTKLKI